MNKILATAAVLAALSAGVARADDSAPVPPATDAAALPGGDAQPASDEAAAPAPVAAPRLPTHTGLHLALTAGISYGGDTLATVTYTDGSTADLKAGGLFYIAGGPSLEFADSPWSTQVLVGRHMDSVTATNGELSFERNTLEWQVFNRIGAHRLGLGYVKHSSPEYSQSGAVVFPMDVTFKDATGVSFEYNYLPVGSKFGASVRAVKIDYETESANGIPLPPVKYSGNHLAVGVYLYL